MSQTSVFGIVKSHSQAERLVGVESSRFPTYEISVSTDSEGRHDIGHVEATKAPEGATTGATAGGITGGVLGLLAGIGALAEIPAWVRSSRRVLSWQPSAARQLAQARAAW